MSWNENLIAYQNRAEENFRQEKSLKNTFHFGMAFLLFMGSTFWAGFTLPVRVLFRSISGKASRESILEIQKDGFAEVIRRYPLVLVDFWAAWCGPCVMMDPVLEKFARENNQVTVARVDADRDSKLLKELSIKGLPHILLFQNGQEIKRHAGPMTRAELEDFCRF
jgi:thioredoxin